MVADVASTALADRLIANKKFSAILACRDPASVR
jgi:hypothetical protein